MKCFSNIAALLCLLGGASCGSNPRQYKSSAPVEASTSIDAPNAKFLRIASVEHRYSSASTCKSEAKAYFNSTGKPGDPPPLTTNPLTYSFQDSTNKQNHQEIRFLFQATSLTEPTDTVISYWAIEKKIKNNKDKDDLDKAIDELEKVYKCKKIHGATQDVMAVNGKKPWRAIMQTTYPIDPPNQQAVAGKISGTFGMIINPPYP